jgi:hypothetical protein
VIVDVMVISPDLPRTDFTIVIPAGPRRTGMKVGPDFAPFRRDQSVKDSVVALRG